MRWEDFFFIVEVSAKAATRPHAGKCWIIVDKNYGSMVRPVFFRTWEHAERSVKRLMQKLEILAERDILEDGH